MAALLLVFGMHPAFITNALHLFDEQAVEQMAKLSGNAQQIEETAENEAVPAAEAAASAEDENIASVAQPMTEEDFRQLDSNLAANGFSEEERASLIKQLREMDVDTAAASEAAVEGGNN